METLKNSDLQNQYDELFAMFATPGWKLFVEDRAAEASHRANIRNVKSGSVDFVKGQLDVLDYIVGLEELTKKAYDQLLAADRGEIPEPSVEELM